MKDKLKKLYISMPIRVGIYLIGIAMIFRLLDIFVFRLDEILGEIILSKTIGFLIVILFVKLINKNMFDVGFNFNNKLSIILIGIIMTIMLMFIGYVVEYIAFLPSSSKIIISSIDPKAGVTGSLGFGLFLILGNIINCFMEEGLFRGILIPMFRNKYSVRKTIVLQGVLFGIWHIPWAFKWYISGIVSGTGGLIMALVINSIPMIFMGIIWGVMYYYTNSIWTSWISHFIVNSILNLIHISINGKLDQGITIRMAVFQTMFTLLIPIIIKCSNRFNKIKITTDE